MLLFCLAYGPGYPYDPYLGSNVVYVEPFESYDDQYGPPMERIDSAMDRTAQYVAGHDPNLAPYTPEPHVPYYHDSHGLPPLSIRRHVPGSTDPFLQSLPLNIQPSYGNNSNGFNKVNVTIKRNSISAQAPTVVQPVVQPVMQPIVQPVVQPVIQPVFYPVNIYNNMPEPQYTIQQPVEFIPAPRSTIMPISPVKYSPPPPPPRSPPVPSDRYETESFRLVNSRAQSKNTTPRRPVKLDAITPIPASPPTLRPRPVRPGKLVIEEYEDYDEEYRVPTVHAAPQKVISYHQIIGKTTRELENSRMDHNGDSMYIEPPKIHKVTYRAS